MRRFTLDPRREGPTKGEAVFFALGLIAAGVFGIVATKREWPPYVRAAFLVALWAYTMIGLRRRLMEETRRARAIFALGVSAMGAFLTVGTLLTWPSYGVFLVAFAIGLATFVAYGRVRR